MNAAPFSAPRLLDGALGTALIKAGMPAGVCPEAWICESEAHKETVRALQRAYIAAGSDILYAPTFGANSATLDNYGLSHRTREFNETLVHLTRSVADTSDRKILVAGDLSSTGKFLLPFGDTDFEALVALYREQIELIGDACDLFCAETLLSLCDARAALFAAKELFPNKPFFASFTVQNGCRTLAGTDVRAAAVSLFACGADAVGVNCSQGPEGLYEAIGALSLLRPASRAILAKPNAGLPDENGNFSLTPTRFAETALPLLELGADYLGGCCGTTPAHLNALKERLPSALPPRALCDTTALAASERELFDLSGIVFPAPRNCDSTLALSPPEDEPLSLYLPDEAALCSLRDALPYLLRSPLCLGAATYELLSRALRLYQGRAAVMTDNLSDSENQQLEATFHPARKKG